MHFNPWLILAVIAVGQDFPALAQNTFPQSGPVAISDSLTVGAEHWEKQGAKHEALKVFGSQSTLGDSIYAGRMTIGEWTQEAPTSGLSIAGDAVVKANLGIGVRVPKAKLDVEGGARFSGTVTVGEIRSQAIFGGWQELSSETPYIDFHRPQDISPDYNARLVNDQDSQLSLITSALTSKFRVSGVTLESDGSSGTLSSPHRLNLRSKERIYIIPEGDAVIVGNGRSLLVEGGASIAGALRFNKTGNLRAGAELRMESAPGYPVHLNPSGKGDVVVGRVGAETASGLRVHGETRAHQFLQHADDTQRIKRGELGSQPLLDQLMGLKISMWSYLDGNSERHAGPSPSEFLQAFGLSGSTNAFNIADGVGVALAAIQGVHERVRAKDREIAALRVEVSNLTQQITLMKGFADRLAALEAKTGDSTIPPRQAK